MPKRKMETHTAQSLKPPKRVEKKTKDNSAEPDDPVKAVMAKLYSLAINEGNTSAAKLYLDYVLKQRGEDSDALTPEEALRILREQQA